LLLTYARISVSEVCRLPLDHADIDGHVLHVKRLKRGLSTSHLLRPDEIRAIDSALKISAQIKPAPTAGTVFIGNGKPLHRSTLDRLTDLPETLIRLISTKSHEWNVGTVRPGSAL
jgi:type 1 fimbriae regulatory protein FimB